MNGMSFRVEAGKQTAFVGGFGEGKTTIFKLLCGLYEKGGGRYLLFGRPFEEWNLEAARSCFSEVSQNIFLFPGTIRQNVACGKEDATWEEIVEACRNANIHDFIAGLPEGYETLVGERGVCLSGGQRQRISIARAILRDAPILLLDGPTASVDREAERKIQEAVDRAAKGRTVIVIAHRLSTVKNAERIYVVSGGRVAESGNHRELMERQRIAIARAILKGAPVIILDEATSALDNESEALVQEAVRALKGGRTILMIAHRPSSIAAADRVVRVGGC